MQRWWPWSASMDFYYLKRFSEFTFLYEFNGFKALEKTTAKNTAFTDAERNDQENQHKEVFV